MDASIELADFSDALERLVIKADVELGGPEVAAEAFDGRNDDIGFEIKGNSGSFVVEGGTADRDDGENGAVGFLLFESSANTVYAGVVVGAKRAGVVCDGVPFW